MVGTCKKLSSSRLRTFARRFPGQPTFVKTYEDASVENTRRHFNSATKLLHAVKN